MEALFAHKTPVADMHDYPVNTNHAYCFTPEQFSRNGLLGLHPIERTFKRENKQFWREVVKANARQIRFHQRNLDSCHAHVEDGQPSPSQAEYIARLEKDIDACQRALRIAAKHRLTTFGMVEQKDPYAKGLLIYLAKLRSWELHTENSTYRCNVIEDALCEFHNNYWYHAEVTGHGGTHNAKFFKELVAIVTTSTEFREFYDMGIHFLRMTDRLERMNAGAPHKAPTFAMSEDFDIKSPQYKYKTDEAA